MDLIGRDANVPGRVVRFATGRLDTSAEPFTGVRVSYRTVRP